MLFIPFAQSNAQTGNYWSESDASKGKVATDKAVGRVAYPKEFKLFSLDMEPLHDALFSIVGSTAKKQSTIISLPNADGQIEQFEVFEASNFDAELQAQFPEIRAYSGKGITDKYATLKIAIAPNGITTTVFRVDKPNEFIEAYSADHTIYSVYKSQRDKSKLNWACTTVDQPMVDGLNKALEGTQKSSAGQLKVMRLAQSCTGEYAAYFGASTAGNATDQGKVLTAFNNTLTRCNGVYEKDLGVHLNLIAATTNVIYYNAATDPYSAAATGAGGAWNGELEGTLNTSLILPVGSASIAANNALFDIGHLFGASGGGGNAGCIGCVCVDGTSGGSTHKGSGFTSPGDAIPQGDNFDIDYVVHEVGHQMGGNHTFTFSGEANVAGTRCTANQVEVGSGITIMGYAGITSADVAAHSIDAYSAMSIAQIQTNLAGKTCPVTTTITANNATPTVTLTGTALTIPISTPFALDCTGADANAGDVLTYSWEQVDSPLTTSAYIGNGVASSAAAAKTVGPNFISFAPSASSTRYFPKMSSVMANSATTGWVTTPTCTTCDANMLSEALSSVARTLNFRVTVRDNSPYVASGSMKVGQTNFANLPVTVNATGGAFSVSSQGTTGISYVGNSSQTVTWVAGSTAAAPFNATNVDILISYDSGATWNMILAGTPNDGTQAVTMPNPATTQTNCRLMVRSAVTGTQKSYFFDVNNNAFTITPSLNSTGFEYQNLELFPNPTKGTLNMKFTTATNNDIVVKVHDLRGRLVFEKSYTNNGTFDQAINLGNVQSGTYLVSILEGNNKVVKRIIVE